MLTLIVFIIILGFLVFVHELGHFFVARINGIKAEEFGFGFPPRALGIVKSEKNGSSKWQIVKGNQEIESKNTIYSINWIPIGGFVRIKGENGDEKKANDSFAAKSAWIRTKVLIAGVAMNFVFAWILFSTNFMLGTYQDVTGQNISGAKILVQGVDYGSPAQKMDLRTGDFLIGNDSYVFKTVSDVQNYISDNKGKEIVLIIEREGKQSSLKGIPRENVTENQGALGISGFGEVIFHKYSLFKALWMGLKEIGIFLESFVIVIAQLFHGNKSGIQTVGPIGIVLLTGKVLPLGFSFLLRFTAILSINLGVINILPIPALDGGRLLFIIIEKIKGSKINQEIEQILITISMAALLFLMAFISIKEIMSPEVQDNFKKILHSIANIF